MTKLRPDTWKNIENEIKNNPDFNITRLSRKYHIARKTIYEHCWKKGIIVKESQEKPKKKGFWERLRK